MDRRQKKSRQAIFNAFIGLLSKKHYNKITVGEIIEVADVGRATFYSHFETKDFLLKELCAELFDHIFNSENIIDNQNNSIFNCDIKGEAFLHLFKHIKKNDNNICKLLSSNNNELFLEYFKSGVYKLIIKHLTEFNIKKPASIPEDFWINHVTATFIETLKWWTNNKLKQTPEEITEYYFTLV